MGLHDFVNGAVATEGNFDEMARQTVIPCTTSTKPSPPLVGMHIYLTDYDLLQRWDGTAWKTWPKGLVKVVTGTGTGVGYFISTTVVVINGSQVACTNMVSGEKYRYTWNFAFGCNAVNNVFPTRLRIDGTNYDIQRDISPNVANIQIPVTGSAVFTVGTGNHTMDMTIFLGIGAGGGAIPVGGDFTVDHLGSA